MMKQLQRWRATVWLLGSCLKVRINQEVDIAADMLERESDERFRLVTGLGFIWELGGVLCAFAKAPNAYCGVGDMIAMTLLKLMAVIMIPLGAVVLVPVGRVYARRWRAKRK